MRLDVELLVGVETLKTGEVSRKLRDSAVARCCETWKTLNDIAYTSITKNDNREQYNFRKRDCIRCLIGVSLVK